MERNLKECGQLCKLCSERNAHGTYAPVKKSIKHSRVCALRSLKADEIIGKFSTRGKKHAQRAAGLVEAYLLESGKLREIYDRLQWPLGKPKAPPSYP